jgi:hypothetical protein
MPSYFDLLKYAATGIASPSMTYYDKMRASTLMGGAVQTLTGIPPLSFKSNGKPLISWSMKGNGQQQGTPTPDAPIQPIFCGARTGQLFDENNAWYGEWVNSNGTTTTNAPYAAFQEYEIRSATVFVAKYHGVKPYSHSIAFYDSNGDFISRVHRSNPSASGDRFDVPSGATKARYQVAVDNATEKMNPEKLKQLKIMLNTGSAALPYEPYGWKIPITCAGQTVPVYLGEAPTVRRVRKLVLDGTENWKLWAMSSSSTTERFYINVSGVGSFAGICTHFQNVSDSSDIIHFRFGGTNNNEMLFWIDKQDAPTVADFKAYLAAQYAAGTPVCVWYVLAEPETEIINEPLAKIGDYADELSSTDAGVSIPTVKGQNTLTVETELQPSEMSITYKG